MLPELVVTDFAGTTLADDGAVMGAYRHPLGRHEVCGAEAALHELKRAGVKIALGSGFDHGLVELLLRRLGWQAVFDHVTSSDDVPRAQ